MPLGERDVRQSRTNGDAREFVKELLNDVRALEGMLEGGMFETGTT